MGGLQDRRVVVTGGASGIGLAVARRMVASGGTVCLVGRRPEALEAAVEQLGGAAWAFAADVGDAAAVDRLGDAVAERWGALDGLVNNAGLATMATLVETDPESWRRTFEVNVTGPYLLCRRLHGVLSRGRTPAVVNVSSTLAEKAIPGMAAYNSAKAALNQLTRSVALEWAPGIRVNAIMPAVVDTPIHATRGLTPEEVQGMGRFHPMQRVGTPEDVAAMVVYLLSDDAAWMTGAVVPVDGGMTAG